ncbi:MAG: adenosylmethionine-8-amino-7-oxononanoate aminotransferase [Planctomycetota bacterium]|jgi:adenosylmethionine-8-amino-7-oxononanoate aminotransferase
MANRSPDSTVSTPSLIERDRVHLWHPYTQHGAEADPLPVVSAHAARLTLEDGRELIDAISSWWAILHGHAEPELLRAMNEQGARLDHVLFAGATHEPAVQLAERLCEVTPAGLSRVFYSDDGSTAVEVALKMVLQSWRHRGQAERVVFIALEGAYHGDTFGAMALGEPEPFFSAFGPLLFEVRRVPTDEQAMRAALDELGPRAAGVIVEPLLQGAAGMKVHPAEFLRATREACTSHGVPLIADEVMTGFGRTGHLFACEAAGIAPDLLCLAKGLTGGLFPLSATMATEEIFDCFLSTDRGRAFFHGHTFTAHPIGCAIALASLRLTLGRDVPARLTAIGRRIRAGLSSIEGLAGVADLRQLGGMVALDLHPSGAEAGYLSSLAPTLRAAAFDAGVLLRPLGNVLYALPPACTTEAECDRIAEVMVELTHMALG